MKIIKEASKSFIEEVDVRQKVFSILADIRKKVMKL